MRKDSYYYYCLGEDSVEKGNLAKAEEYYLKSIDLDKHFKTHHKLYYIYNTLQKTDEAEYHLKQAFLLNSKNDRVALDYAKLISQNERYQEALEVLESILLRNACYGPAIKLKATLMLQQS